MMAEKIYLMGNNNLLMDLYKEAIAERNELFPQNNYELVVGKKGSIGQHIQFIAFGDEFNSAYLKEELQNNASLKALIFTKPRDFEAFRAINQLMLDYPLSVLGVAEQPIQPARIWEFLDRVEAKTIQFEWEEGDWDEF